MTESIYVILGADLTTPAQIARIASLPTPPPLIPCSALNEDDEDDGTSPGCCIISSQTATLLKLWSRTHNKVIKNIFVFVQAKPAHTSLALRNYPVAYFFYGRLCDPGLWVGKLGCEREPRFVDAWVRGWGIRMWGGYKALVPLAQGDGEEGEGVVKGKMYMVESEEVLKKIAAYETDNYAVRLCEIVYGEGDGDVVKGCVFAFAGEVERLRSVEEYEEERRAFEELEAVEDEEEEGEEEEDGDGEGGEA